MNKINLLRKLDTDAIRNVVMSRITFEMHIDTAILFGLIERDFRMVELVDGRKFRFPWNGAMEQASQGEEWERGMFNTVFSKIRRRDV